MNLNRYFASLWELCYNWKICMKKTFLLLFLLLLTSCFYRELQIEHTVEGYDKSKVFCTVDWVYEQNGEIPYHKSFTISIWNNDEYGIYLPKRIEKNVANAVSLVDEHGENVHLSVSIKSDSQQICIDDNKIIFEPSDYPKFFIKIPTPQIPSYEIEFRFEKNDGSVHVFSFKMNQERVKKWHFFPLLEIIAGA
ncbi:MAG: hypothetical protein II565_03565, partial [Fibrobacter sp.]|nr:hypothetical protein [Fibrobacter sp.]